MQHYSKESRFLTLSNFCMSRWLKPQWSNSSLVELSALSPSSSDHLVNQSGPNLIRGNCSLRSYSWSASLSSSSDSHSSRSISLQSWTEEILSMNTVPDVENCVLYFASIELQNERKAGNVFVFVQNWCMIRHTSFRLWSLCLKFHCKQ